jgi:hypothetical protein
LDRCSEDRFADAALDDLTALCDVESSDTPLVARGQRIDGSDDPAFPTAARDRSGRSATALARPVFQDT